LTLALFIVIHLVYSFDQSSFQLSISKRRRRRRI